MNANLLVINNGVVDWCYKGTKDECNNSILATYHLHEQKHPIPILAKADRAYGLKMIRTLRGILSYTSRTQYRADVKKALMSDDLDLKIEVLKKINLNEVDSFEKNSKIEAYKFLAFQMGQTLALLRDNVELFTKNSVSEYFPELKKYLEREESNANELQKFLVEFTGFISNGYTKVKHHQLFCTKFHGKEEVLDCKKELVLPDVVIFDIDGTLVDETHRKEHRDNKDWDTYFDLCHLDTPIQHMVDLVKDYKDKGYEIWLMSGRYVSCEEKTIESMWATWVTFDRMKLMGKDVISRFYTSEAADDS